MSTGAPPSPSNLDASQTLSRAERAWTLSACALLLASLVVPIMRWSENAKHDSAGGAPVFGTGDGYTLADGGFPGTGALAAPIVAIVVLAAGALAGRGGRRWRQVRLVCAVVVAYLPVWVLSVFVSKWEDEVYPAEGVAVMLAGCACLAVAIVRDRRAAAAAI